MALVGGARYARRMDGVRAGVGIGVIALAAVVLGCQSMPSERTRATPTAAVAATVRPTAVATRTAPPIATVTVTPPVALATAAPAEAAAPPAVPPAVPGVAARRDAAEPAAAEPAAPYAAIPTAQPPAPRPPRAFRTPERSGDRAFIAPPGGAAAGGADAAAAPGMAANPNAAGQRGGSGVVILRATARTAIEGFDVRVTYPQSLGRFSTTGDNQADCTGAAGAIVTASDRGMGEARVLVASASALALPFDVFCRFSVASGARLDAADFAARVAEVASDGKKADPGLVVVDVVVR